MNWKLHSQEINATMSAVPQWLDWSEVPVNFQSSNHANAKFMARPCYIYLKLKMLGPNGVIMVSSDPKRPNKCDNANTAITDTLVMAEELDEIQKKVNTKQFPPSKKQATDSSFQLAKDTKNVQVHPEDSSKTAQITTNLPAK